LVLPEDSDIRPLVEKEDKPVCAPIYRKYERNLLFRVLYYNKESVSKYFMPFRTEQGS